MKNLSGQDALFLHLDLPHAASHATMIYIYDQSDLEQALRLRQIIGHLEQRLDVSPMFRSKIVQAPLGLAYPYWTPDPGFDIDFHVRHFALPQPGDWRQFCIMAARLHARSLDLSRPPWEMYVIEGLDRIAWLPKGSFALITKIHHAAIDGTAATELTWALHDVVGSKGKSTAVLDKQKHVAREQVVPGFVDTVSQIIIDNVGAPFKLAAPLSRALPKLSAAAWKLLSRALMAPESGAPRTRFNRPVSNQRVFESVVFELAMIKRARAMVPGATVNDAVLAIVGGAMRRYLESKEELPGKSLMALAPVNTRQDASERKTTGNAISFLTFPLGSDIADPLARLVAIQQATTRTKALSNAIGGHDLTDISKHAPPATLAVAGRMATMTGMGGMGRMVMHNCTVTNVPGPNAELTMLGAKLRYWSAVAPITDGLGALFTVTSYNGQMVISLTSCPEMVPDPAFFGDCIRASIAEMAAAAAATSALPAGAPDVAARATRPRPSARPAGTRPETSRPKSASPRVPRPRHKAPT
ncbi:wax ester/triacylglycerol synthase family O-acyltransferase [Variovorax sp. LARHSF232]